MKNSNHLNRFELEGFEYISKLDELQENVGRRFIVNNIEVAVFKINSEVFALSNICPHQQTHLIYDGFVEDEFVVCPAHGWRFNLRTGKKDSGSNGLQVYPVKVVDGQVYVQVMPKQAKW